ncbi:MAG: dockerin type I repeat-containing protein, partial [Planctomycetota bacterium]
TENVAFGGRFLSIQQEDDAISLGIDTTDGGQLIYETAGNSSGFAARLQYNSATPIDLAPSGENAIVLTIAESTFQGPSTTFPRSGFLSVFANSSSGPDDFGFQRLRVPSADTPVTIALQFSLFSSYFNPHRIGELWFGNASQVGTLWGDFAIDKIETKQLSPGDYNGDGMVNAADYAVWRDAIAIESGPVFLIYPYQGDGNGDGRVDTNDLAVWRIAYGSSDVTAIPEPAAVVGLLTTVAVARLRRGMR